MLPGLSQAQSDWLKDSAAQLAAELNLDELTITATLTNCMSYRWNYHDPDSSHAWRAARQLGQLAGWSTAEALALLDDLGFIQVANDDTF